MHISKQRFPVKPSEHAGGVGHFTFAYPTDLTRRIADPLGTERILGLTYPNDTEGASQVKASPQ
jgi:hypothetical protein